MTTKSQEIEQARKELELLKEKERSLEAKLGLLSKNEEYQYAHNVTNSLLDEPLPVNYVLSNENLFQSILMNGELKESSVDDLSEIDDIKPIEETDMLKNRKNIVEDLIYDEDENVQEQKIHEEISEDEKLDDFQFSITNNSQLNFSQSEEELDSEKEEDLEERVPIDHRNDIFQDIYDAKNREKALKIERGLFVESDQSSGETESSDETQIEDSRDRIVREIEEEKLRELELQSKYRGRGILLNRTLEEPEKTQLKDNIETRQLISIEINDLQQREEELRRQWTKQNRTKKRKDEENIFFRMQSEPHQYLENGNSEEIKATQELIKLENILYYHESEEEEREERKKVNPRGKIIQEIEELHLREQELKERTQGIQQKQMELHIKQQEQLENEKKEQQKQKMNLEEQVSTKIMQEILELQRREEDLERQYAKIQQRKLQMSNMLNGISSLYLNDSEMRSLDTRRFSVKDNKDLKTKVDSQRNIKTNESTNKSTNQARTSHAYASSNGNKTSSKEDIKNYPKVQRSSYLKLLNNDNRKKKKIILGNSSDLSNGLVSQDAKYEDNMMQYNEKPRHHSLSILPLATKWENKAEEEHHKQLAIQREVQNKRDNKIKVKQKKAEQERQIQEQQRLADLERQRTIQERYLLKMKQQGLNDLWAAKKPLVTLEYNEDKNDLHLLNNSFKPIKANNGQYVPTPITLTKTIMKWERRIKRNSMKN